MLPPAEERRSANSNIDCYGTAERGHGRSRQQAERLTTLH
jgi:alpha-beta hydrolase superfamily lysophospholipase